MIAAARARFVICEELVLPRRAPLSRGLLWGRNHAASFLERPDIIQADQVARSTDTGV